MLTDIFRLRHQMIRNTLVYIREMKQYSLICMHLTFPWTSVVGVVVDGVVVGVVVGVVFDATE